MPKKYRKKNIISYSKEFGVTFSMDFRVDDDSGVRMSFDKKEYDFLLEKLRNALNKCEPMTLKTSTGTFSIIANLKVLHARPKINISHKVASYFAHNSDLVNTPRLLYRSKGPKKNENV